MGLPGAQHMGSRLGTLLPIHLHVTGWQSQAAPNDPGSAAGGSEGKPGPGTSLLSCRNGDHPRWRRQADGSTKWVVNNLQTEAPRQLLL